MERRASAARDHEVYTHTHKFTPKILTNLENNPWDYQISEFPAKDGRFPSLAHTSSATITKKLNRNSVFFPP